MFDEAPGGDWEGGQSWRLVDTRVKRKRYPYTFFVPSRAEIDAITPGDTVKLEFKDALCLAKPTERMWVTYEGRDGLGWYGCLDNEPHNLDGLTRGQQVRFLPHHIASVWNCKVDDTSDEERFFARAWIDHRILDGEVEIGHLLRRKPWRRMWRGYRNTGWQVFGATGRPKMKRLAIGLLLNHDDGMLDLLKAPFGAKILRVGAGYHLG